MSAYAGVTVGLATASASAGLLAYAARGRSSTFFGDSVYRGDPRRNAIALTFDDGPSESTPLLLDILDKHRVPATFFMCGQNVRRCPEIAQEVKVRGHEIGNHSDSHPRFDFKSSEFIYRELTSAQESIAKAANTTPRWFRAPYGVRWFGVGPAQKKLSLTGVMWTVIARDWNLSSDEITNRLLSRVSAGGILCLHDGRGVQPKPDVRPMLDAMQDTIPRLQERGFQFLTLSQLLCPTN